MNSLLENKREQLAELCARYRVRRLALFGSAVSERFDLAHSDLDFAVESAARTSRAQG